MTTPAERRRAIRHATLAAQRSMNALDAAALQQLRDMYLAALADIDGLLRQLPPDAPIALHHLARLQADIGERLRQLDGERNQAVRDNIEAAAATGAAPFPGRNRVSAQAVQFVHAFQAADGLQLSDRLWRLDQGARDRVKVTLDHAVIQGWDAEEAARRLLGQGRPLPAELTARISRAKPASISQEIAAELVHKPGSALSHARRLMRTELNRAHGEAYIAGALADADAAGVKFLLSPGHPEPDICDLHAAANLYGLGAGVYPDRASCPWPAHPNTLSYVAIVFRDEVSEADKAGRETLEQAAARLAPAVADNLPATTRAPRRPPAPRARQPAPRIQEKPKTAPSAKPPAAAKKPVRAADGRDAVSAEHFNGQVTLLQDVQFRFNEMLLTGEDLKRISGAIDGSVLSVTTTTSGHVRMMATHPFLKGEQTRTLSASSDGQGLVLHNDYFVLKPDVRGLQLGVRSFAWEVRHASKAGIKEIETYAAGRFGHPDYNGYYTWPRLGYDADLKPAEMEQLPGTLKGARTIQDLMRSAEGRDWWKKNGSGRTMYFDLAPGSRSQHVLEKYLQEKGIAL